MPATPTLPPPPDVLVSRDSPSPAAASPPPAARAVAAVKVYGRGDTAVRALDGIDVEFARAEFTAVMGASGSGKSTLLHCLAGLDRLTSGETYIGDVALSRLGDNQLTLLRRQRVGFIFQSLNLVPTLDALENIVLPLTIAGRRPAPGAVEGVVEITGLADRLHHRPSEMSGGQQQRVAAARALASRPEIIFADEPTGNLDSAPGVSCSASCAEPWTRWGRPSSWSPTTSSRPATPTGLSSWPMSRVASEMRSPTPDSVLDVIRGLGERAGTARP